MARVDIDNLSKSLVVFGDRFWSGSKMTPPQPFGDMRLDWTRAWGGAGCEENPHGVGFCRKIIRDKASTACRTLSPPRAHDLAKTEAGACELWAA
jgi:hypothetical protein